MTRAGFRRFSGTVALLLSLMFTTQVFAEGWPRTIMTPKGSITLQQPPQRIVSTSVTVTGTLLAIHAPVIASGATAPNNHVSDAQGFFRQWGDIAKQRGVQRLYIGEPNAEAIAGEAPDLIIIAATGGDSALKLYDQLSAIAPVMVVNYDDKSWQELATELGQAIGKEADAASVIAQFSQREAQVKKAITLPPQPVSALVYGSDGKSANLWTPVSPQGQLLQQLGFTLAPVPLNLAASYSQGKRHDIIQLAGEKMPDAMNGQTLLLFSANQADAQRLLTNPFLATLPAVQAGRVYAMGDDTFRLDYYSASNMLNQLEKLFVTH